MAYLTGQRPADVLGMRRDDIIEGYLLLSERVHRRVGAIAKPSK